MDTPAGETEMSLSPVPTELNSKKEELAPLEINSFLYAVPFYTDCPLIRR